MLKDITLGQYFPGNSFIHRLDPRTKLVLLVVYIVALFSAASIVSYSVMLAFLITCILISKIPPKAFLRGMKRNAGVGNAVAHSVAHSYFHGYFEWFLYPWYNGFGQFLGYHHFHGGYRPRGVYAAADSDAYYRNFFAHIYHFSHCTDGRIGVSPESFEENQGSRP